jgi:hypothetical protein
MNYPTRTRYAGLDNINSYNKMAEISKIKKKLKAKVYQLTPQQMEQYTSDAIKDQLPTMNSTSTYFATHSVSDDKHLHTWDSDSLEENDRDDFLRAQRELLDAGGQLIRIFIFSRSYYNANKEKCSKMLIKHNDYYQGTCSPIRTMIYLYNPQKDASLTQDFTIVNNSIVLEWYRSLDSYSGYADGKCFTDEEKIKEFVAKFETLKKHARDSINPDNHVLKNF